MVVAENAKMRSKAVHFTNNTFETYKRISDIMLCRLPKRAALSFSSAGTHVWFMYVFHYTYIQLLTVNTLPYLVRKKMCAKNKKYKELFT